MQVQVCCLVADWVTNSVSLVESQLTLEVLALYIVLSLNVHRNLVQLKLEALDLFGQALNGVDRRLGLKVVHALVNDECQLL